VKLGRQQRPAHARSLALTDHATLSPAPAEWDGTPGSVIALYGNGQWGDCVLAAVANLSSVQAAAEGAPGLAFDEAAVVDLYHRMSPQDTGLVEVYTLDGIAKSGFLGRQIQHFAGVDFRSRDETKAAAYLFSGLLIGVDLPPDFMDQFDAGVFDVSKPGDPELGHALAVVGFDDVGPQLATWGRVVPATWLWWEAYCREAYVLLDAARLASSVLDGASLVAAAAELARETGAGA
jgi:hypothetical protein